VWEKRVWFDRIKIPAYTTQVLLARQFFFLLNNSCELCAERCVDERGYAKREELADTLTFGQKFEEEMSLMSFQFIPFVLFILHFLLRELGEKLLGKNDVSFEKKKKINSSNSNRMCPYPGFQLHAGLHAV
jgi:hypothetical protein